MNEAQGSKRDLKDVVGVFLSKSSIQEKESRETAIKPGEYQNTQIFTFFSPFNELETFALNLIMPALLTASYRTCYLATNTPTFEDIHFAGRIFPLNQQKDYPPQGIEKVRRLENNYFWISGGDKQITEYSSSQVSFESRENPFADSFLCLDLVRSNSSGFENTIRILDHIVIFVRPRLDDLKNAYKVIKSCYYINRDLQTSIIFNAQMSQMQIERVFSRFAGIISQFLVLPVRCLGASTLDLTEKDFRGKFMSQLNLDILKSGRPTKMKLRTATLEKIRFLNMIKPCME